jgi:phytoene dehydrogenase-like protein
MADARKIVVIGGGIAGLCAAVYARKCGYEVELLEMHDAAGGLATSWRRDGYTFETCLHWLLGSNPRWAMYRRWQEVFDISQLNFVYPEEFLRVENERGEHLTIYANVDRMEAELLRQAPQDAPEIRRLASAVRHFTTFELPDMAKGGFAGLLNVLRMLPYWPALRRWSRIRIEEYGRTFTHPLLRGFFGEGEMARLSALALILSLAWMSRRDAGYPIGGSQAAIRLIVENLRRLGGQLRLGAKVEKILVEHNAAVGVQLADSTKSSADWVISAADGHATLYELLSGRYTNKSIDRIYGTLKTFPSYLQVSLGVARHLSHEAGYLTRLLDAPLVVDRTTQLRRLAFRIFHFDATFAPPGKTAVTCFLPTRDFEFWTELQRHDPSRYQREKQRVADAVIAVFERSVGDIRQAIEVIDVSTPATVIRYTGNWKGSMEGWLLTPDRGFGPLPMTLPGLRQFMMVGQWVMPGGGLPTGLMTARSAIQAVCRKDGVPFVA